MGRKNSIERVVIKGESEVSFVWLHGYGANAWDLLDLASLVDPQKNFTHYFPNAPLDLYGMGSRGARAWFPLDLSLLQNLETGQSGLRLADKPRGPAEEVLTLIDFFLEENSIDPQKLVLGGFSQGAILSLHWLLKREERIPGLVLLSGAPLDAAYVREKAPLLKGQKFFQSHGRSDPVLAYSEGEVLSKILKDSGFTGRWLPFNGGHEVSMEVINSLKSLLPQFLESSSVEKREERKK
jgi:phospholipase/carboxylesterase